MDCNYWPAEQCRWCLAPPKHLPCMLDCAELVPHCVRRGPNVAWAFGRAKVRDEPALATSPPLRTPSRAPWSLNHGSLGLGLMGAVRGWNMVRLGVCD